MSDPVETSPGELPLGWLSVPLGRIAAIQSGVTKNRRKNNSNTREVPYLRVANVQRGWLDLDEIKTIKASPEKIEKTLLRRGDVLFNEGGDRDKLGRGWIWSGEIKECVHQNHVFRARLQQGILPKYVSYFGNSWAQEYFLKSGKQTTNLASINQRILKALPVRLAPLPEQHRIVDAIETQLTRLDAAVASLERVRANLKRARASVLKAAVEGRLVPTEAELARQQGRPYEPASVLLERILEERRRRHEEAQVGAKRTKKYKPPVKPRTEGVPELPEGWVWATIDQLISEQLRNGKSAKATRRADGIRTLTLTAVTQRCFTDENTKITTATKEQADGLWLEFGDILVQRSNTPELVGSAALFTGPANWAIFPDLLIRVRLCSSANSRWVDAVLQSPRTRDYFKGRAQGIAGSMPKISQGTVGQCSIPLPPRSEQRRIVGEVERRFSVLDALNQTVEHNLQRCERLRQSILKRAFEGKLVPQDPNDEPASELLARIQADS